MLVQAASVDGAPVRASSPAACGVSRPAGELASAAAATGDDVSTEEEESDPDADGIVQLSLFGDAMATPARRSRSSSPAPARGLPALV